MPPAGFAPRCFAVMSMGKMTLIGDNSELKAFCDRLAGAEFVAVDTECRTLI
jgi:hypothetical protein